MKDANTRQLPNKVLGLGGEVGIGGGGFAQATSNIIVSCHKGRIYVSRFVRARMPVRKRLSFYRKSPSALCNGESSASKVKLGNSA